VPLRGERGRHVEDRHLLRGLVRVREDVGDQCEVDGEIRPLADPRDRHAHEEDGERLGERDDGEAGGVEAGSDGDEDLPAVQPVRQPATDRAGGEDEGVVDQRGHGDEGGDPFQRDP
jgi:hypothetical protein